MALAAGDDPDRHCIQLYHHVTSQALHPLGRDFAGVPGSRIYDALATGELTHRSCCLRKNDD